MLSLRTTTPFDLFDRLEHQLTQQLHGSERVPAAEVHESADAYTVILELPGVDRDGLDVKATDRTLAISAERRSQRQASSGDPAQSERPASPEPLLSEFRYGTWSRSFRFPTPIEAQHLNAVYRDGLLTVTAPKAQTHTTVKVKVEG
ncbi:Hsp20/alpha crystallin family protein [Cyanobium sp. NIES-981]|uniref:Hsp20/alpha crystallin family protein n=1 Tax=Cyanobium sp. NIES-981 TaxID=1851505 RepID=UPI0007DE231B|nr:Hsp20/alpha crystallin family protein [Cyanobium sp. NIES-981]SBO42728.1 Small heat shock protein family protein [Cyanobium sp. NIES-981]